MSKETHLEMPTARAFGWALKPNDSAYFEIDTRPNGQFSVVLNHALLRGVTAEMIHWWFRHFPNLSVRLENVPQYDGKSVPAYMLWHPVDHHSAALSGKIAPDGAPVPGTMIHIREAMQYETYGWKYPVDAKLKIFYVGSDGWAMGKVLPLLGPVMMLRIHFKDVLDGEKHTGVHYHYEVVIGASGSNPVARFVNARLSAEFGPEFFSAWQRHNVIEVGTFEAFLPALYAQRDDLTKLCYSPDMAPAHVGVQQGFDRHLFDARVAGFKTASNPYSYQAYDHASFL